MSPHGNQLAASSSSNAGIELQVAIDPTTRVTAIQEYGSWLIAGDHRRRYQPAVNRWLDGGSWRGPTEAAWMTRLLHGAPPPRRSTGTRETLVAHG